MISKYQNEVVYDILDGIIDDHSAAEIFVTIAVQTLGENFLKMWWTASSWNETPSTPQEQEAAWDKIDDLLKPYMSETNGECE